MTRLEEVAALHAEPGVHYSCCQCTLIPFRELCGIDREKAFDLGTHFGGGMGCGATCGTVTGAMMVLGMAGASPEEAKRFRNAFREKNGSLTCAELLQRAKERGVERRTHCDGLIDCAVTLLEEILGQRP